MQRILHIVGIMNRAGAETMIMNLYRSIDRNRYQFDFIVFSEEQGDYDSEIRNLGGEIFPIIEKNPIKRMFLLKNFLLKNKKYKIVHSHTLLSTSFHLLAAKFAGVKFRIAHGHSTNSISSGMISYIYEKFSKIIIQKYSTHQIACGTKVSKYLFSGLDNVILLPNSIDTNRFAKIGETNKTYLNDEFKIDDSFLKIIQIGRIERVKNFPLSIEIAEELKKRKIKFRMFFVGQGTLSTNIQSEIEKKDLLGYVHLLGLRTDIPQLMAGADIMLMPSLYEGFPVVLVESQAVGLKALISDKISDEVDLNVGLISFESIENRSSKWIEKILFINQEEIMKKEERLNILQKKGFDINSSVYIVSDLYEKMK